MPGRREPLSTTPKRCAPSTRPLRSLALAGAQVRRAIALAQEAGVDRVAGSMPAPVLVAALGGSSLVRRPRPAGRTRLLGARRPRAGRVAHWVGPLDLVIAVSQSGRAVGPLPWPPRLLAAAPRCSPSGRPNRCWPTWCAPAPAVHVDVALAAPSSRTAFVVPAHLGAPRRPTRSGWCTARGPSSSGSPTPTQVADEQAAAVRVVRQPRQGARVGLGGHGARRPRRRGRSPVAATRAGSMLASHRARPATHRCPADAASQVVACSTGCARFSPGRRPRRSSPTTCSPTSPDGPYPALGSLPCVIPTRPRMPWCCRRRRRVGARERHLGAREGGLLARRSSGSPSLWP